VGDIHQSERNIHAGTKYMDTLITRCRALGSAAATPSSRAGAARFSPRSPSSPRAGRARPTKMLPPRSLRARRMHTASSSSSGRPPAVGTPDATTKTNLKLDYFPQESVVSLLLLWGEGVPSTYKTRAKLKLVYRY
jgi:hypothetical protein